MIFGAILAGGVGTRMHISDMPKQFLPMGEKPIIVHTLEKFLACGRFDVVYVGVHRDWVAYMKDLAQKHVPAAAERIRIIAGGDTRNETIHNIIDDIDRRHGDDGHIIVTHDSVRPFVSLRILEENIDGALQYGAVDTVIPATDTIVVSAGGHTIDEVPERAKMYRGQTPQSFRVKLLKELYASLSEEEKAVLTDACKICVMRDYPVRLVQGSELNMKITTPADYKLAQAILGVNISD